MTERTIPAAVQSGLESGSYPEALLAFLTIEHKSLVDPIRLVSDVFDYVYGGETYTGLMFGWRLVTDTEQAPEARLVVANVDRRIGRVIRDTEERPQLNLVILTSADFDKSADPRTAIGTPDVIYSFAYFELVDVQANVVEVSGRIHILDPTGEPWPFVRATQARFPGLFA